MQYSIIKEPFSPELIQFVREHYIEQFGRAESVPIYTANLFDNIDAESFVVKSSIDHVLGGFRIKHSLWSSQILDFTILPEGQGQGIGRALIECAQNDSNGTVFLDSRVYYVEHPFAKFLIAMGFKSYEPYPPKMCEAEWLAYNLYKQTGLKPVSFRKKLWLHDFEIPYIKEELAKIPVDKIPIVLDGLDKKLGHYKKSGKLSYRYDVCPVCKDMSSTLKNPQCEKCYIKLHCQAPFQYGFRHDPQVGQLYFETMKKYLEELIKREKYEIFVKE